MRDTGIHGINTGFDKKLELDFGELDCRSVAARAGILSAFGVPSKIAQNPLYLFISRLESIHWLRAQLQQSALGFAVVEFQDPATASTLCKYRSQQDRQRALQERRLFRGTITLHQRSGVIQIMCGAQNAVVLDTFRDGCNVTRGSLPPVSRRNRAQYFGAADERSDLAGYMDIEDRGCHATWAGIARGKRRDRDGCVESGSLQQQVVKMAAKALETSTQYAGELEKFRAQITEQEATAQGLRIELATLRGHANEEFAAICSEIEAVRNGIADASATAVQSETQKILEDTRNGKEEQRSCGEQFGNVLVNRIVKEGHSTGKWQRGLYGNQEAEDSGWEERTPTSWWKGSGGYRVCKGSCGGTSDNPQQGIVGIVKWKPEVGLLVAGYLRGFT
ncbi:hypothetical protein BJ742DRAFT_741171 [Cladochytrium replicatum]|nr:hypothetical protein BJ742DRAFT_741171 [Cladochytrium replicatum]